MAPILTYLKTKTKLAFEYPTNSVKNSWIVKIDLSKYLKDNDNSIKITHYRSEISRDDDIPFTFSWKTEIEIKNNDFISIKPSLCEIDCSKIKNDERKKEEIFNVIYEAFDNKV